MQDFLNVEINRNPKANVSGLSNQSTMKQPNKNSILKESQRAPDNWEPDSSHGNSRRNSIPRVEIVSQIGNQRFSRQDVVDNNINSLR